MPDIEPVQVNISENSPPGQESLGNTVRESDWSLEDVLDFSPESKGESGTVQARTNEPNILNGEITVKFTKKDNVVRFRTENPDWLVEKIKTHAIEEDDFVEESGVKRISLEDDELNIVITPVQEKDDAPAYEVEMNFSKYATGIVKNSLRRLQLAQILQNHDIPPILSSSYAEDLVEKGQLRVGNRTIPIRLMDEVESPQFPEAPSTQIDVFHGTSLTRALAVAQAGFFAENPDFVNPVLSSEADGIATRLARGEWEGYPRTDPSGYGAIVHLRVDRDQLIDRGEIPNPHGGIEEVYQPSKCLDGDEKIRLLRLANNSSLSPQDPGYISPEAIVEIILVKQTAGV